MEVSFVFPRLDREKLMRVWGTLSGLKEKFDFSMRIKQTERFPEPEEEKVKDISEVKEAKNYAVFISTHYDEEKTPELFKELKKIASENDVELRERMKLEERGGGWTNTGSAVIYCALDGSPLVSVGGRATVHSAHAVFFANAAVCIECSYWNKRDPPYRGSVAALRLREGRIEVKELGTFEAETKRGTPELSSPTLETYLQAIKAAMMKCTCYHCRSAYYATGVAASGMSGPRYKSIFDTKVPVGLEM